MKKILLHAAACLMWAAVLQICASAEHREGAGNRLAEQLARESKPALQARRYIRARVMEIRSIKLRRQVLGLLDNPAPTYQLRAKSEAEKRAVLDELKSANLLPEGATVEGIYPPVNDPYRAPQSFLAAPGSYYESETSAAGHHAYPGGLAVHTAFNMRAALALMNEYRNQYGASADRDLIIAAVALHDVMKTLVFQWNDDGSQFLEQRAADTGIHHVLGLAEQFARGLPPEAIIATASAHNPTKPGPLRRKVVDYIRAAAIIAKVDPVDYGALRRVEDGFDLAAPAAAEHFIINLSDSDYPYAEFAASAVVEKLREIAAKDLGWPKEDLKSARFNWFRNAFLSANTGIGSYRFSIAKSDKTFLRLARLAARRDFRRREHGEH